VTFQVIHLLTYLLHAFLDVFFSYSCAAVDKISTDIVYESDQRITKSHPHLCLKPRPHQQQCRSDIVECYKSKRIEHAQFVSTLSKGQSFTKNLFAKNGNNVEATFNFVEATFEFVERIARLVSFDSVACVDLALLS